MTEDDAGLIAYLETVLINDVKERMEGLPYKYEIDK